MRNYSVVLILALFSTSCSTTCGARALASDAKPKFGPSATRLHDSREYIRKSEAPDFWALVPYYTPQQTGSACSVASVAMVVNAARADQKLSASQTLVTQDNLLSNVGSKDWKKAVSKGGGGVTLEELGKLTRKSLESYGFKNAKVEVVHASGDASFEEQVRKRLAKNEKNSRNFMLANFLQSEFTGDPEGAVGHIAPVGAYDAKADRVLIFDPDRSWYEPYWVSTATFIKGMNTRDSGAKKTRGFVFIEL